jgi:hypothetical protein
MLSLVNSTYLGTTWVPLAGAVTKKALLAMSAIPTATRMMALDTP